MLSLIPPSFFVDGSGYRFTDKIIGDVYNHHLPVQMALAALGCPSVYSHPVLAATWLSSNTWLRGEVKECEQPRAVGKHTLDKVGRGKTERKGNQHLITNVGQDTLE